MTDHLTCHCTQGADCPFLRGEWCERVDCNIEDWNIRWPPSASAHEKKLRALACCVTGRRPVTLQHCRGGSMATNLFGSPGAGQKQNPFLQIPLHMDLHVGTKNAIDGAINGGVQTWESQWGTQVSHLVWTSRQLRYSLWTLAWLRASPLVKARIERFLRESRSRLVQPPTLTGEAES